MKLINNMVDPTEEEVMDDSINECPLGQEKNELGECVDIELSPYDILPGNNFTKEDFPKIKEEYKEDLKEKAKTERDYFSSPYEVILSIESKEKVENFNSKYEFDPSVLDVKDEGKIDELASLAKGEELFNELVLTDQTINKELIPETAEELQPIFETKILELRKKYDGTTSEEWIKAEEEYNKFYNDKMMEALGENAEYKEILNAYENIVGDEIESEYRAINRIRLGLEDNADMSEGWKKFKKNLNKSWVGLGLVLQGDNVGENEFTKLIDQKIKEGVITSDTVFAEIDDIELKKAAQKIDGSGNMFRSSSTKTINDIVYQPHFLI